MSLYEKLVAAKIPLDHHESDLYVLATKEARAIVRESGLKTITMFVSQVDGKTWLDIPFAYEPFWTALALH